MEQVKSKQHSHQGDRAPIVNEPCESSHANRLNKHGKNVFLFEARFKVMLEQCLTKDIKPEKIAVLRIAEPSNDLNLIENLNIQTISMDRVVERIIQLEKSTVVAEVIIVGYVMDDGQKMAIGMYKLPGTIHQWCLFASPTGPRAEGNMVWL